MYVETIARLGTVDYEELAKAYYDFYTTGPCKSGCYQVGKISECCSNLRTHSPMLSLPQDSSTRDFLRNMREGKRWPECGAQDTQVH